MQPFQGNGSLWLHGVTLLAGGGGRRNWKFWLLGRTNHGSQWYMANDFFFLAVARNVFVYSVQNLLHVANILAPRGLRWPLVSFFLENVCISMWLYLRFFCEIYLVCKFLYFIYEVKSSLRADRSPGLLCTRPRNVLHLPHSYIYIYIYIYDAYVVLPF